MRARKWTRLLVAAGACAALAAPALAGPSAPNQRGWSARARPWAGDDRFGRRPPRGYQEPAFARGYSDGYSQGAADGRDRGRYDPVRHKDYRAGDAGYSAGYGSRDAYRNNYRAGFRQGYEDGYRDNTR